MMATSGFGRLEVTVIQARNLRDVELIGKNDPYVSLTLGTVKAKSSIIRNSGDKATWNETFTLDIKEQLTHLAIKVRDHKPIKLMANLIGETRVLVEDVAKVGTIQQWFKLEAGSEKAGEIEVRITYIPDATRKMTLNQFPTGFASFTAAPAAYPTQ
ncbi:C2 domain-containing protein [Blastocladiella britannica]|nr:C2 domain-containing protein [Blastocladiella britannica]